MEFDPNKDEVVKLLTKLKSTSGVYPPELLAERKTRYLQQVAQVSIAAGAGLGIKEVVKASKGPGIPPTMGTLLETVLVVAIVAEAGALGYVYREKLAEFLNNLLRKPAVEQTVDSPTDSSPVLQAESTASPVATETPLGTPSPVIVINGTVVVPADVENPVNPASTPVNAVAVPTDKRGNQYGLTPIPERTREPNGGDNAGGNNGSETNNGGNNGGSGNNSGGNNGGGN